ncbi:LemA family protein [Francisella philomiragia]|uniref:LemA family protein n=1 Tax=Francisella philomiragia TaxID=28110 RepID=UPI001905C812|nr:LemA family protein [Francisella philomiragia]MBK2268298.1 LemA family protein [Francisella philomiragia]MBK2279707.1 LemA family protein [Francisella philomiragia]MBK2287609.1 LemA family protein [Francisella philomiragia]MBK2289588.1 LemA family protein [Francisella philomiragia]MBK2291486.1 LemA family protein [Francisella philomiragia]
MFKNMGFIQKTIVVVIALLILYVIAVAFIYTSISSKRQTVESNFANIHAAIQRKADLLPELSKLISQNTVTKSEKQKLLENIQAIQKKLDSTNDPNELYKLQQGLNDISATILSHLQTGIDKDFLIRYQAQVEGSENRINIARYQYNQAVDQYNSSISGFFGIIVNDTFLHYKKAIYYHSSEATGFEASKNIFES